MRRWVVAGERPKCLSESEICEGVAGRAKRDRGQHGPGRKRLNSRTQDAELRLTFVPGSRL